MKKSLEQLETELQSLNIKRINLVNQIDSLNENKQLPLLKEKYEGKYFKYRNQYSAPCPGWCVYLKLVSVESLYEFYIRSFQTDTNGDSKFKNGVEFRVTTLDLVEITKEEYQAEFKKFRNQLNKLNK